MFDLLGILLGVYTAYSAAAGTVYIKHRFSGRSLLRDEQPGYFWSVIGIYGALSLLLIVYF